MKYLKKDVLTHIQNKKSILLQKYDKLDTLGVELMKGKITPDQAMKTIEQLPDAEVLPDVEENKP